MLTIKFQHTWPLSMTDKGTKNVVLSMVWMCFYRVRRKSIEVRLEVLVRAWKNCPHLCARLSTNCGFVPVIFNTWHCSECSVVSHSSTSEEVRRLADRFHLIQPDETSGFLPAPCCMRASTCYACPTLTDQNKRLRAHRDDIIVMTFTL